MSQYIFQRNVELTSMCVCMCLGLLAEGRKDSRMQLSIQIKN